MQLGPPLGPVTFLPRTSATRQKSTRHTAITSRPACIIGLVWSDMYSGSLPSVKSSTARAAALSCAASWARASVVGERSRNKRSCAKKPNPLSAAVAKSQICVEGVAAASWPSSPFSIDHGTETTTSKTSHAKSRVLGLGSGQGYG